MPCPRRPLDDWSLTRPRKRRRKAIVGRPGPRVGGTDRGLRHRQRHDERYAVSDVRTVLLDEGDQRRPWIDVGLWHREAAWRTRGRHEPTRPWNDGSHLPAGLDR